MTSQPKATAKVAPQKTVPGTAPSLGSHRDLATMKGSSRVLEMTVKSYLTQLGLFDATEVSEMDPEVAASIQRGVLNINTNAIKQRMFSDLLRGGTLPPLVVYDDDGSWKIIDGMQRTNVICEALRTILQLETGTKVPAFAQKVIEAILKLKQTTISSKEFLARPIIIQLWSDLTSDELIRLFILLNAGQQKVNPRHLLEVIQSELRSMLEGWGLPISTYREEKEHPRSRGRRSKAEIAAHPEIEQTQPF